MSRRPLGEQGCFVSTWPPRQRRPAEKEPLTEAEFDQHLLSIGLITSLPGPAQDIDDDDPDLAPVIIKREPFSETIIRERRYPV